MKEKEPVYCSCGCQNKDCLKNYILVSDNPPKNFHLDNFMKGCLEYRKYYSGTRHKEELQL